MKFGLCVANVGSYASVRNIVSIARDAEEAGWDGVFLWDTLIGFEDWNQPPVCDPWIALAAVAVSTERIRLGTTITPIARRRPWKLARETVSLDRLSRGRFTLGVGLGNPPTDYSSLGEDPRNRVRAAKLDEGLDILLGLWSGEPFSYRGEYYQLQNVKFTPPPSQRPRIPVWVGGLYPNMKPWERAARYDGVFPGKLDSEGNPLPIQISDLREIMGCVRRHRDSSQPFDVIVECEARADGTVEDGPSASDYAQEGVTWWLQSVHDNLGDVAQMRKRVQAGPPSISPVSS